MTASWSADDGRIAALLQQGLGQIQVISHEENRMNDTEDTIGEEYEPQGDIVTYPELPDNPHNHRFTISVDGRGPMIVVRGNSAQETREAFEELISGGVAAAAQAAFQVFKGTPPAPQAPVNQFPTQTPPPFGPNVSVPAAAGYQGPPAPQAPQWGGAPQAPAQQQWGGQQAAQGGEKPAYPAPQGWYRMNVPYPGGKEQLHALAQGLGVPKGNPNKGGAYNYFSAPVKAWYCAPEAAQAFAQFTPMAV